MKSTHAPQPIKTQVLETKRQCEITHSQEIKQSLNYQSATCSYGVKLVVEDSPSSIQEGIRRAEKIVERALEEKFAEQRKTLVQFGDGK